MDYKVTYESKEYNLNAVLSFDLLKEVLYKLLISQGNLEKEIDNIKKSNIKRDKDILNLTKAIEENNIGFDEFSKAVNNSYSHQEENEEEEEDDENNSQNIEDNRPPTPNIKNENQNEIKQEDNVINKEIEVKEIKPKPEITKTEEIQFNGENINNDIKEIKNETPKEVILEEKKEVKNENKENNENNDVKEEVTEEKKEEKKEEEKEEKKEETKEEKKDDVNEIKKEEINVKQEENIKPQEQIKTEEKIPEIKNKKTQSKSTVVKRRKKSIKKEPVEAPQIKTNTENNKNNTIQSNSYNQIPPELIGKMAKQIKDNKRQILDLEKRLKKEIATRNDDFRRECKHLINTNEKENQIKFDDLIEKFKEMMKLKDKLEYQMEDCVTKCSSIDVINMFKDSGDGTVDAAKVMVRALEEKIFKKIEFIDERAKKDQNNNSVMKNNLEDFYKIADNMKKEIQNLNENFDKNKEDMNNIKNDFDEYKNEVNEFIKDNSGLKKEIEKIKNREKSIKDSINEIQEKIKDLQAKNINNIDQDSNDLLKLGFGNKGVDEEVIQTLERKVGDLRKKMNDLENTLKLKIQDLEEIQYESKNLKTILEKKITREDLKELYNLHLNDLDEINDNKDNINATFDDIRKIKEQQTNIFQKLENINRNIALLQNIKKDGTISPGVINFDKYVEKDKLTDTIKPILTSLDKIFKELGSLGRNQSEIESYTKTLAKTERVNKVEDDLMAKISELKVIFSKKFVEKSELAKSVKQLELQIKSLEFEKKQNDAETWLMAKQPVGCFNCASCEANIKNVNPPNEYLPWNKYPQQDKIYRMGKGFSHMLQMMTSEFVKSIGNAQKDNENEFTPRNSGINHNFVFDKINLNKNDKINMNKNNDRKQSASVLKINNKEQFNEEALKKINNSNLYSSKLKGKMQLPRVLQFKKKLKLRNETGVPVSDDEMSRRNETAEKEGINDKASPKIMKIMKKKPYIKTEENVNFTDTYNSKF